MPMNVFVAGGTGVLGRTSIRALIAAGHRVRATARGEEKAELVRRMGAAPVAVDLYDEKALRSAIAGSDAVLRLTTKIGAMSKLRDPRTWAETMRLRTEGARMLVDAAIAVGASVYMHESVTFVYADGGASWLTEDDRTDDGGTAILLATLEGEREAERFTQHGGRGIVLRFGGFYAPDAPSTLETIALVRKRMMPQIGTAANYFSSIYVPDAGSAVAAALSAPAGIYNVVDDTPIPFAAYLQTVARAVGARRPFHLPGFVGKWMFGDVWRFFSRSQRVSNARLKYVSGWQPEARSVGEGWRIITAELDARNTKQQPVSQARNRRAA